MPHRADKSAPPIMNFEVHAIPVARLLGRKVVIEATDPATGRVEEVEVPARVAQAAALEKLTQLTAVLAADAD